MGTCLSKNNLKKQLLDQDSIILSKEEFEDKIKSKFNITEPLEGFDCYKFYLFRLETRVISN